MAILTTNLRGFLIDVVKSDFEMKDIFGDEAMFYVDVEFSELQIDEPTAEEKARVKAVCEAAAKKDGKQIVLDEDDLVDIWRQGVRRHYEKTFIDEHYEAMKSEIEDKVKYSFEQLTTFFEDELQEAGVDVSTLKPFKVQFDWDKDILEIEGDLTALEVILIEAINGYGVFGFESLEDFRECNIKDQSERIRRHLHHMESIEDIYGTTHEFFYVRGLADLERYRCFGDFDVTDEGLIDAMYY